MSDDLISRQAAIDALEKKKDKKNQGDIGGFYNKIIQNDIDTLMLLPSADRPQGEWIDAEIPLESGGSMPIQACNLCKTFYPLAYTGGGHRFCPNCGAEMKGAESEG